LVVFCRAGLGPSGEIRLTTRLRLAVVCRVPALAAGSLRLAGSDSRQPWRCLWRGFWQITMTVPRRRMILHFSQILLTDGLTFKFFNSYL
jgi:hypothetical protein